MSLAVWAYTREKVLKEVFRYKQLIVKKQNNLETVLEHMPDGIVVLNSLNQAKLMNDSLKRILNIHSRDQFYEAFKRLTYSEGRRLYPHYSRTFIVKDVKDFTTNERLDSVTFGVTEIDSRFYEWKGSISPWNNSKSLILLARDITALIELEKSNAIQVYQRAILRALSHELRTPLSIIISTSENIRSQSNLTDVLILDKLSMINTNSKLLLNIINNLLDFVQITNNKFQLYNSYINFRNLIQDTINLFACQATHKNILLSSSFDANLPLEIFNDSNRIQQILINLLSNSLK
jgi:signal transduction histidine kinase